MTPEQKERLEYLRTKPPVRQEAAEVPVHMTHAHFGGEHGMDPCACPDGCAYCPRPLESKP
jgi:hypothetical protein